MQLAQLPIPDHIQALLRAGPIQRWRILRTAATLLDVESGISPPEEVALNRHDNVKRAVRTGQMKADLGNQTVPHNDMHIDIADLWAFASRGDDWWEWCRGLCKRWAQCLGMSLEHLSTGQPTERAAIDTSSEAQQATAKESTAITKPSKRDPDGYFPRLRKFIRVQDPLGIFKRNGKRLSMHEIAKMVRGRWDSRTDLTGGVKLAKGSSTLRKALKDIFEEIDAEPRKAPPVR